MSLLSVILQVTNKGIPQAIQNWIRYCLKWEKDRKEGTSSPVKLVGEKGMAILLQSDATITSTNAVMGACGFLPGLRLCVIDKPKVSFKITSCKY